MNLVDITATPVAPAPLKILTPDTNFASVILYQCFGEVTSDLATYVRNNDPGTAIEKHTAFLSKAKSSNASLAITPEYSTAWTVIEQIAQDSNIQPDIGSLWVLGCESITPQELERVKQRTENDLHWHHETLIPVADQTFFGAAILIYHLPHSTEQEPQLAALVQFKTREMGGTNFERDGLIRGQNQYILHNPNEVGSIKLITLICADAFDFYPNNNPGTSCDLTKNLHPDASYLILHIQLNSSPYYSALTRYRQDIYGSHKSGSVEIISLNWASQSTLVGDPINAHNDSAYYLQPTKITEPDVSEDVVNRNHNKSVHLRFSSNQKFSTYLFGSRTEVLKINITKVKIQGHHSHRRRSGVVSSIAFEWSEDSRGWNEVGSVDDGIWRGCEELFESDHSNPLYREKLIAISTGNVDEKRIKGTVPRDIPKSVTKLQGFLSKYWMKPRAMNSFYLKPELRPDGTLALLDSTQESNLSVVLAKVGALKHKLGNANNLPEVIEEFQLGNPVLRLCEDEIGADSICSNVVDLNGGGKALVVELGDQGSDQANKKFDEIKRVSGQRRIVVFYRNMGVEDQVVDKIGSIDDDNIGPDDINRV